MPKAFININTENYFMKQRLNRFFSPLYIRWIIAILLVVLPITSVGLYKYFHPDIYRIPSNPDNLQEITLFALGDQGSGSQAQRAVASSMEKVAKKNKNLDFVVLLGDNFYIDKKLTETSSEWNTRFEEMYSGLHLSTVPFYAVLGNNDIDLSVNKNTHPEIEYSKKSLGSNRWRMPAHYFSNDYGISNGRPLLRIVYLDTNATKEELLKQADYIREQFIKNPVKPIWKIVAGHHTIRSCGKHYNDKTRLAEMLLPVLQESEVDIYLSGHDHNQQLIVKDGEPGYVINGAGGKSLYPQKTDSDDLRFFRKGYGFVSLKVNATKLSLEYYDDAANKVSSHELQRDCKHLSSNCIKAIK